MTIEQIMQLSQAGFSADQITALAPLLAGNPQPQPQPQPGADPVLAQLAALTAALQQSNINNSNNRVEQCTPESVAAYILDPRAGKEGK